MEVIHLILGKANPLRMNGVNRVVNELATRQTLAGIVTEVWGITRQPDHDYPARNYTTRLFSAGRTPFTLDSRLKDAIRGKKGTAVFHLHGGFVPVFFTAALFFNKLQIPYVITPHGSYNQLAMVKNGLVKRIYFHLFEKKILLSAKAIHSIGASEVTGLKSIYENNKTVLIPYGFDVVQSCAAGRDNTNFTIGYCGRIDLFTKGLVELLEGFGHFRANHAEARLWIIGDGEELKKLINKARELGLGESVTFFKSRFGEEKMAILRKCDVFAAPSRNEGLPTAVLEAASVGLPALVTEATNMGDYIRMYDAGFVVRTTDAYQISEGLTALYHRINVQKQGPLFRENAYSMVSDAFNWNLIVQLFQKLYA